MKAECRNCRHWSTALPLFNDKTDEPIHGWGTCLAFGSEEPWRDTSDGAPPPEVLATMAVAWH